MAKSAAVIAATLLAALVVTPAAQAKSYANCTALNKAFPAGVARDKAAADRTVAAGMQRPRVDAKTYADNAKSDRDKDGVACERS